MLSRPRIGLGLSVVSGLLLFAAGEPLGWGVVAWVALVPLLVATLSARMLRWAWLDGLVFGLTYFALHLSWIFLFGWMAWTGLVIVMALYVSVPALLTPLVRRMRFAPVLVAGLWAGAELWRDRWPFGGYSWGSVGTTQGAVWGVRFLAGTVGAYGLSFLVVFVAALVAGRIVDRSWDVRSVTAVAAVLALFVAVDLGIANTGRDGAALRVAVVQGNVPRPVVTGQRDAILANHLNATRRLLSHAHVDLVVWPEESVGDGVSPDAVQKVEALSRSLDVPILFGQSLVDVQDRFLNVMRHADPHRGIVETYQKRHQVPFGERVPIEFLRRFVGTLNNEIPSDQIAGRRANVFEVAGTKVATPICFESVFPRDFLDFVRNGAQLFVLSTNDSSFERSYASEQHVAHTRMRALETRQWVIEAALSGISAEIDPAGRITHATTKFTTASFVANVRARPARSLYAKTGDLFPALFAALAGLAAITAFVRRRRASEQPTVDILTT